MLILIPLVATCACLGGDENVDKWNEIVDTANVYAEDGGDLVGDAEDAYYNGDYDLALSKADQAVLKFNLLLDEIDDLMDVAEDMDKDFAVDYVEAWRSKITVGLDYIDNLKMLIYIDKYGEIYMYILNTQDTALNQMYDLMDYYNSDSYQLALTTADIAYSNFGELVTYSEDLEAVALEIGTSYVTEYSTAVKSLFTNLMYFVEYARLAASAAVSEDFTTADSYVNQANVYYTATDTDQNTIDTIEANYPGDFPEYGYPLSDLYYIYYQDLQDNLDDIGDYDDEMENIEDDNDDFFE